MPVWCGQHSRVLFFFLGELQRVNPFENFLGDGRTLRHDFHAARNHALDAGHLVAGLLLAGHRLFIEVEYVGQCEYVQRFVEGAQDTLVVGKTELQFCKGLVDAALDRLYGTDFERQFHCFDWLVNDLGVNKEKLRLREHAKEELSHYSNGTTDVEYEFPFGWGELWGIASRTNYDLTQHQNESKVKQEYIDPVQNKRYIPYVVEPSLGVERLLLVLLCDAYDVEKLENDERTVLHFDPKIAPVKVAVLPLVKKGQVKAKAEELYQKLLNRWNVEYDETQSIGKRYRRQDELGTPFCVTVDFDTVGEGESDPAKLGFVTVRERDSMKQELVKIDELEAYLSAKLGC